MTRSYHPQLFTGTYKPRTRLQVDLYKGEEAKSVHFEPTVIEAKWTKNNHLAADELTVTTDWLYGGIDPRLLKNARVAFWLWEGSGGYDKVAHLRFTGIVKKVTRRWSGDGLFLELSCQDYTTLFIGCRPLPTSGYPEYSDTLQTAWERICDNVGHRNIDPDTGKSKIISNVKALRDGLIIENDELAKKALGGAATKRFLQIARPVFKDNEDAWSIWVKCCEMVGAVPNIEGDRCFVNSSTERFRSAERGESPWFLFGQNIYDFQEEADTNFNGKGVLLKSFDPTTLTLREAAYPLPGDERLKQRRAVVKRAVKEGREVNLNEQSKDYEEFLYNGVVCDQEALEARAQEAYEEFSRRELQGSFKTAEMFVQAANGERVDILSLRSNEPLIVRLDPTANKDLAFIGSEDHKVRVDYLVESLGYEDGVADLIVSNIEQALDEPQTFHISSMEVSVGPEHFEIEIKYHNLINLPK